MPRQNRHGSQLSFDILERRLVPTSAEFGLAAAGLPIPALNSNLGAQATLFLKFDGETVARWLDHSNIVIPAYDTDGKPASFNSAEITAITNIWRIVSQNYAIFNINVSTVDPRTISGYTGRVSQIDVGGDGAWTGLDIGGFAEIGGMVGSSATHPVRGYAFSTNLLNGNVWATAQAICHESGHTMGLEHQSSWSGSNKTAEYQDGPGDDTAPIMGISYDATRGMWWYGKDANNSFQDDLAAIANATFGFRADEAGDTYAAPAPLDVSANQVTAAGILTSMTDLDVWSFSTLAGTVQFQVSAPDRGSLHPKIQLLNDQGNVVVNWVDADKLKASWSGSLQAGTYYLVVASHGISAKATASNYGFDVGQYTIQGTILPLPNLVATPTNLAVSAASSSQINLTWKDNATNEGGYVVERSDDGGAVWATVANLPADSASYADTGLTTGIKYAYRVRAYLDNFASDYSNQASAFTLGSLPGAPSALLATRVNARQIKVKWTDNAGNESGFYLERAITNTRGVLGAYTRVATLNANTTLYLDKTVVNTRMYSYRIRAFNNAGISAYSKSTAKLAGGPLPGALGAALVSVPASHPSFRDVDSRFLPVSQHIHEVPHFAAAHATDVLKTTSTVGGDATSSWDLFNHPIDQLQP